MNYYIGADLGTSALKLLLCDETRRIFKTVSRSYEVSYPYPGWSEQSPEDWWEAFLDGVGELLEDIDASAIKGIAVGGQMHGLVILDENDAVIRPAILWNDGRTDRETAWLNQEIGKERLSEWTANIAFAGFTAPKLLWLRKNEPQSFARIRKIMLPKDYLNYRLTGVHASDLSDASGLLLLDVKNRRYSEEMLSLCGIREGQMPRLYESYEAIGTVRASIAEHFGFSDSVTVAAGAGDNAAAAIGTATVGEGKCNISLGTSGTVFISSKQFAVDDSNALHAFCHADGGYHLMGCMLSAASCNRWFCADVLGTTDYAAEQAAINEDLLGRNHVYFLPYLMGERSPINDTDASGMFIGLRPDSGRKEMVLAVLEGVAFAIRDSLEVAKNLGITVNESTVCGGGARSKLWLKILANVLGITLKVPSFEEGPAYGAVSLAMTAAGEVSCLSEAVGCEIAEVIVPDKALVARYERRYESFRRIYPALRTLYRELREDGE